MLKCRAQWGKVELERRLLSEHAWQERLGGEPSRDPEQQGNRGRSEPPALCLQGLSSQGATAEKEAWPAGSSGEMSLCRR